MREVIPLTIAVIFLSDCSLIILSRIYKFMNNRLNHFLSNLSAPSFLSGVFVLLLLLLAVLIMLGGCSTVNCKCDCNSGT
jgi:hypothetical protein